MHKLEVVLYSSTVNLQNRVTCFSIKNVIWGTINLHNQLSAPITAQLSSCNRHTRSTTVASNFFGIFPNCVKDLLQFHDKSLLS